MIVFPNAKINLGLFVTERLPNGYHNISTCLYPIPWSDILEVTPSKKTSFNSTGINIPKDGNDDIIVQAYKLLKKDFQLPELDIHLHKLIPIGAGLGGGSSDAAFMLKLLSEEFRLFLNEETLEQYASELGSDCPFFIRNSAALASGTGTELKPISLDLAGMHLVMVNPGIHHSTKKAYAGITPKSTKINLESLLIEKDFDLWKRELTNDFEESVFKEIPELNEIKRQLYDLGASYAAMSGSGSSMFGLFVQEPQDLRTLITHSGQWTVKKFML